MIFVSGCAGLRAQREPEGNYVEVARLGMEVEEVHNRVIVELLQKGFPAELSGVKRGDVVVSVDGKTISSAKIYHSLMDNKRLQDRVFLAIDRNGYMLNLHIEPIMVKMRPTQMKFLYLLNDSKKVTIAVIVSEVTNAYQNVPKEWADSVRINLQSEHERGLLSAFGRNEGFSLVDSARLKQFLDKFQNKQTGFISDTVRAEIGEKTGATHILDISFARSPGRDNDRDDMLRARIIDIESGDVLAVDQIKTH